MKKTILILFVTLLTINVSTQAQRSSGTPKQLVIETENTALVFSVGKNQKLYQVYLGEKLNNVEN